MENETREGQVASQLNRLEKAMQELATTVEVVEDRLGRILRSDENVKDPGEPRQELVPLANSIFEYVMRTEQQTGKLKSILSRLEL